VSDHPSDALLWRKEPPDTHFIGGSVVRKVDLYEVLKRKILSPFRDSNPNRPTRRILAIRSELSRLLPCMLSTNVLSVMEGHILHAHCSSAVWKSLH
jgi:hypothetical protein